MRKLKILYTSDVHGYLFPTNYASTDVLPQGLFKLEAAFRRDGNTLIIDGGDMLQGSPFAAYVAREKPRPHPCAQAMNLGGYQYVALGNHDFNMGLEALGAYLQDLHATLPVLQYPRPRGKAAHPPMGRACACRTACAWASSEPVRPLCAAGRSRKRWRCSRSTSPFPAVRRALESAAGGGCKGARLPRRL